MNDLFAPPGNEWRPVSPRLRTMRRLLTVVTLAVLAVASLTAGLVLSWGGWVAVPLAVLALVLVPAWFGIGRNVASWGYAEREEDLFVTHGALFRELVAVPYGRMQYVDITSGPFEQLYGVATVHLHTASPSSNARIPGLPKEEAARLRDRLTELGQAQAAGL